MLHKTYQSCESLEYAKQHSPQLPQTSKQSQHSPGFIQAQAYPFSPSPNYQQSTGKVNIQQRKLPAQHHQPKLLDQTFSYGQSSSSCSIGNLGAFHDPNLSSKHSPSQSIKSPDVDSIASGNLVLQTFRNENQLRNLSKQPKQQSIYGTASRKYFTTERSHSMLDASHFQKHQHFVRQQKSIANELKEKQKLKQQTATKDFLPPMYQAKETTKSHEFLSDELSEEDTPSSGLSG